MISSKTIKRLKQMACCAARENCDLCAYANYDCITMPNSGQDAERLAEDIPKIVKLLEADASEPAESDQCIEEMEILFGRDAVISYCRLAAYKYKYRAGHKDDAALDYAKADWYLDKAKMLSTSEEQEVHDAHKQQG